MNGCHYLRSPSPLKILNRVRSCILTSIKLRQTILAAIWSSLIPAKKRQRAEVSLLLPGLIQYPHVILAFPQAVRLLLPDVDRLIAIRGEDVVSDFALDPDLDVVPPK